MTSPRELLRWPLLAGIIAAGVLLRLALYFQDCSLTYDEARLAENVLTQSFGDIVRGGTSSLQAVPGGFLVLEKAATLVFGASERALRLVPLAAGVLSVILFWRLAERTLSRAAALVALLLFAINVSFVEAAAQARPYSLDVLISLWIAWVAIEISEIRLKPDATGVRLKPDDTDTARLKTDPTAGGLILSAALCALFSSSAVLVLAAAAVVLAGYALMRRSEARRLALTAAAIWTASAVAGWQLATARQGPEGADYLYTFWRGSFVPWSNGEPVVWFWRRVKDMFGFTAGYRLTVFWIALLAIGAWSFVWSRRGMRMALLLAPFAAVVIASAAGRFPLASGRVQLFYLVLLFPVIAEGVDALARAMPRWAGAVPMIAAVSLALYAATQASLERGSEDMKSLLQFVTAHREPSQSLYVYYGGRAAFGYYAPRYGLRDAGATLGACARDNVRDYLREIDQLRGRSVWVLFTHAAKTERDLILAYLDVVGVRGQATRIARPGTPDGSSAEASAYLYDLRDVSAVATAETFPIPAALTAGQSSADCYGSRQLVARLSS